MSFVFKNLVCNDRNLRHILKSLFEVNGWSTITRSGVLRVCPHTLKNYPSYLKSRCIMIDLALRKRDIIAIFEVKSLLYARLRSLKSKFKHISYGYWHSIYHFADPETALKALRDLRRYGKKFYDYYQDKEESIAELYRESLGFITDSRLRSKVKILGVIIPWYAGRLEANAILQSMKKLQRYLHDNHNLEVNLSLLEFKITHERYNPRSLLLYELYSEYPLNLVCNHVDVRIRVNKCDFCKYNSICIGRG